MTFIFFNKRHSVYALESNYVTFVTTIECDSHV